MIKLDIIYFFKEQNLIWSRSLKNLIEGQKIVILLKSTNYIILHYISSFENHNSKTRQNFINQLELTE